ncbi:cytochrome c oxidase subunit 5A, mitochondrial [Uranotaenia lowii]|uniref:cytochrome c oxidase subunit 5A, mitochondrial n=1 Tax=Uranotaenia lowii TaxID=190385 RepID=UPI00247986DC|nr:cytochrome c oxidase subunit 5A, mitochondrial [Uranotaenia lowii]XP_055592918.1 cytochrome c oxidase subunit 5A, mitochondrial [Uranotaenia lowii]XP_055592919.1 cytochrome c oxidase subunit 5A, mitochondrial [Uranotaenia lowii]
MLRSAAGQLLGVLRGSVGLTASRLGATGAVRFSHSEESAEEFDARYEAYFNRKDIDHWEARKAMNDLLGMDLIPDPKIINAALRACRRLNDYALAIRFLEGCKDKCGNQVNTIYPYLLQEIRPTLTELGIDTPEELGYDQPELALKSVYDIH